MGIFKRSEPSQQQVQIELNSKLFEKVYSVMELKGNVSDKRVPYDSEQKQPIEIVG